MTVLESLATVFGIVANLGLFPQVLKIYKRKSAVDISLSSNIILLIAGVIWTLYGFEIQSIPIISANFIWFCFEIFIVLGCILYGTEEKAGLKRKLE